MKYYYPWIDIAKIIGIYFVTIGHGSLVSNDCRVLIYSFHIPLFFIISGMLYKRIEAKETLRKTWKTIMVPYLIINVILLSYYIIVMIKNNDLTLYNAWTRIGAILMGLGYYVDDWKPVSTPLWFAISLWIIYLLVSLSKWKYYDLCLLFISLASFLILDFWEIDTYFPIDSSLMAIPFFLFGLYCKRWLLAQMKWKWLVFFLIPIWYFLCYINGRTDINTCNYGSNLCLFYICGVCGSLIILSFCQLFVENVNCCSRMNLGGIKTYSSGTFLIMGFNLFAISYATDLWFLLFPSINISIPIGCIIGIIILVAFYPLIFFCKKRIPAIIGYR